MTQPLSECIFTTADWPPYLKGIFDHGREMQLVAHRGRERFERAEELERSIAHGTILH
jgi:hypothetical protein